MNAEKWPWPIFGCKVGQSVPIGMKLELDVWHYLLNVYTMFQNEYHKTCRKKTRKTSQNPKRAKIIAKIPKIRFLKKNGTYVEKYTAGHLRTKFEEFTLIYKATIAKIEFDLLLAVN